MTPASARSTASFNTALVVSLPGRECCIQIRSSSMVKAISWMLAWWRSSVSQYAFSCANRQGEAASSDSALAIKGCDTRWAPSADLRKHSPTGPGSPVMGSRVKATPVPDVFPCVPGITAWIVIATPPCPTVPVKRRCAIARSLVHELRPALTAPQSCVQTSCGKGAPVPDWIAF